MNIPLRCICFAAALAVAAGTVGAPDARAETGSAGTPHIVCDNPTWSFGAVDNNQVIEHTFVLANRGDAPLKIERTRTSCGCTVANVPDKTLDPGEQTELTARLSLKGRRGRQNKTITVVSNDPDTPNLQLRLQGEAVAAITVSPRHLFFGQIGADEVVEKRAVIISRNEDLDISGIDVIAKGFEAESKTLEPGRKHEIVVRTTPPLSPGRLQGNIAVETTSGKRSRIHLPIRGNVVGALAYAPERIVLADRQGSPVTRYIVVRPGNRKSFRIEEIQLPSTNIKYNVFSMNRNGYRIQLSNLVASESLHGKSVKIATDVAEMSQIEIPITVQGL